VHYHREEETKVNEAYQSAYVSEYRISGQKRSRATVLVSELLHGPRLGKTKGPSCEPTSY